MKKKVAIVGYTPTRKYAPYRDPEWEIWGVNDLFKFQAENDVVRWDRWFELHEYRSCLSKEKLDRCRDEFKKWNIPVYMQKKHPDIPCSVEYPLQDVIDAYGDYLTNSISYMVALAILEGFEEIGIYGVDMSTDSEYGHQRPSCEYWVGVARGRGITVNIHPQADLLKARFLYGYDSGKENEFCQKLKSIRQEMGDSKNQAANQLEYLKKVVWQYDGAITAVKRVERLWNLGVEENEKM